MTEQDTNYMVTGLRKGYRVSLVRDLSHDEAVDLKNILNRNNISVSASVVPQGIMAPRASEDIDEIIRKWRKR